jgi:hypothetical protein
MLVITGLLDCLKNHEAQCEVSSKMWIRMMGQPMSEIGSICCLILLERAAPINENAGKTASNHKVANIIYKTSN